MVLKILVVLFFAVFFQPYAQEVNDKSEPNNLEKAADPKLKIAEIEQTINRSFSEEEIIQLLKKKHAGTLVGDFIESYPRLIQLTVRVTTNQEIKKIWAESIKNKSKYYILVAGFLLSMVINWWWKRSQLGKMPTFWVSIKNYILRFTLINFFRIIFFVLLFELELRPVWILVRKTFGF